MKKKFAASFVAMALAMSMPMGALAFAADGGDSESKPAPSEWVTDKDGIPDGTGDVIIESTQPFIPELGDNVENIVVKDAEAGWVIDQATGDKEWTGPTAQEATDTSAAADEVVASASAATEAALIEAAGGEEAWEALGATEQELRLVNATAAVKKGAEEYQKAVAELMDTKLSESPVEELSTIVLTGKAKGSEVKMTVTFTDAAALAEDNMVHYVILHENGMVEKGTAKVDANGCITFTSRGFSAITFLKDTRDGVEVQDSAVIYNPDGTVEPSTPEDPAVTPDTPAADQPQGDNAANEAPAADAEKNLAELGDNPTEDGKSPKTGC